MSPRSFFDLTPADLAGLCEAEDMPRYVPAQLMDWVYAKGETNPERMTNIAQRHRTRLAEILTLGNGTVVADQDATDGTRKLLVEWTRAAASAGGALPVLGDTPPRTECVMIPAKTRRTACISSQAGCPVGCRFCASGLGGLETNLTRGEIVEQVFHLGRRDHDGRITNVVFMGMGEPLANYAAVTGAIRTINASWGFGIGARRITLSTVGLPAAIRRLVDFELPIQLALSLHAPNDEIRRQLIPWAEYATMDELLDACRAYFDRTGREITLEYLLLRRVNDRPTHARELASVARGLRATVNLIRYNEVSGLPYDRPTTPDVLEFQSILKQAGVRAHIRASRGRDIAAACGQLRHEKARARR